jgi:hypothetical protein
MSRPVREKSTNQLAVWRELAEALDQVDVSWRATQQAEAGAVASPQLPGNVAVALVRTSQRATEAIVGLSEILADQYDTGNTFIDISSRLRQALDHWPPT